MILPLAISWFDRLLMDGSLLSLIVGGLFLIALLIGLGSRICAADKDEKDDANVWIVFPSIGLAICILIGLAGLPSFRAEEKENKDTANYLYQHRFDSDVVVIQGRPWEIGSKIQEYIDRGYDCQGGACTDRSGYDVFQTVVRRKK